MKLYSMGAHVLFVCLFVFWLGEVAPNSKTNTSHLVRPSPCTCAQPYHVGSMAVMDSYFDFV